MPSSIRLLRNAFVRAILISNLCSQLGIWIRNFAVLLYVMDMTGGNAFAISMISVAEYGPIFLFAFIGVYSLTVGVPKQPSSGARYSVPAPSSSCF